MTWTAQKLKGLVIKLFKMFESDDIDTFTSHEWFLSTIDNCACLHGVRTHSSANFPNDGQDSMSGASVKVWSCLYENGVLRSLRPFVAKSLLRKPEKITSRDKTGAGVSCLIDSLKDENTQGWRLLDLI